MAGTPACREKVAITVVSWPNLAPKGHVMREGNLVAYQSCSQADTGCSPIVEVCDRKVVSLYEGKAK